MTAVDDTSMFARTFLIIL